MSDQAKKANKFAREKLGAKVDEAAGAAGLRVVKDGGEGEGEASGAPWVELPGGGRLLSQFAHELGNHLSAQAIFRRENVAVTVNFETGALDVVSADRFRTLVERHVVTYKPKLVKSGNSYLEDKEPCTMSKECAGGTLASDDFMAALRKIARVNRVRLPVVREDGKLELLPEGFDEASQTYTLSSGIRYREDLKSAEGAAMLRDLLKDFPLVDERSLAVAVAEMVALFAHGMQEPSANRMGFIHKSNKVRTGKSLIAQMAIAGPFGLAKGQALANQEELKKLLDATALQGAPYLFFDNLTGHVKSNLLEGFMTTPVWTGRVMGSQKTFEAEKGTIVILTGNNLTTSPDIAERVLLCSLHAEEADPQGRSLPRIFTAQKLASAAMRSDLLSALWAMVRGWDEAGRPRAARRIAGFEEWSDLVGGIVTAAGFADPLARPKDEEVTNREDLDAHELVEQLAKRMPAAAKLHEFTFQDLVDVCVAHDCFSWKIEGKKVRGSAEDGSEDWFECNSKSSSALGRLFGTDMAGQIYTLKDGKRGRFGKRGHHRHRRYQVELLPPKTK